jgi:hypothetical protein
MLLNQETLRLVFGLKLKGLRLEKNLSLKDLSKRTGLSPSYLNEIEKGKKYPKIEKILLLAQALDEKLEDLVSLELKKEFQLIQELLDKKFLTGLPFDIFGIPSSTVFELLADHPKKMQALVGTIIELARSHHIEVDDLLFALLRSYLDMNNNYFSELEEKANQARKKFNIDWSVPAPTLYKKLTQVLTDAFKMKIHDSIPLSQFFGSDNEIDYFVLNKGQVLYISPAISLNTKIFILTRELGYQTLKLKVRPMTSLILQLDSFEQLVNHFSASYFAGSLLIPEQELNQSLVELFKQEQWSNEKFLEVIGKFSCTIESFFHRMTQIVPEHFGMGQLFYLRYEYDLVSKKYQIAKELHLSSLHAPHKVKTQEHYCGRWLIHQLTSARANALTEPPEYIVGAQKSSYAGTQNEYLVLASSFKNVSSPQKISCVCLGLLRNQNLEEKIRFLHGSALPQVQVGETCQRCSAVNCSDREAPEDPYLNPNRFQKIFQKVAELES